MIVLHVIICVNVQKRTQCTHRLVHIVLIKSLEGLDEVGVRQHLEEDRKVQSSYYAMRLDAAACR
jgi:hypothetical protein